MNQAKIVYLWSDGSPYPVFPNAEGELEYPSEKWTETPPPEGIYQPFYFDGNRWIGQTKEEWEKDNIIELEPVVNKQDGINAQLFLENTMLKMKVDALELLIKGAK